MRGHVPYRIIPAEQPSPRSAILAKLGKVREAELDLDALLRTHAEQVTGTIIQRLRKGRFEMRLGGSSPVIELEVTLRMKGLTGDWYQGYDDFEPYLTAALREGLREEGLDPSVKVCWLVYPYEPSDGAGKLLCWACCLPCALATHARYGVRLMMEGDLHKAP